MSMAWHSVPGTSGASPDPVGASGGGMHSAMCGARPTGASTSSLCQAPVIAAAASLRVGNPEEPGVTVGPVVDERAYKRILEMIEVGKKEATLAFQAKDVPNDGYFIPPTILTVVKPTSRPARSTGGPPPVRGHPAPHDARTPHAHPVRHTPASRTGAAALAGDVAVHRRAASAL